MQSELKAQVELSTKELDSTQVKISKLESKIKYNTKHNQKPKSYNIPALEERRAKLEFQRNTLSLSLNDEKKLLKDINFITK